MARRSGGLYRSFKNDAQLKQYYLDGVVSTDKTLGVGSYGSVVEVEYRQIPCAAKRMHELLLDPGNQGVQEIIRKYRQECQLMASLRHPNITQFLGLCFLEGSVPLLVMEKLEMSVDDLLECAPSIPLPVKISILTDTCGGLVYLHGMPSPIVHRDLTARNVLLTSSLSAKITDMGNSRIVNLKPAQLAQTMSKLPGTLVYMPPEALNDSHRYGPSLDIFSFGHLTLYCLTQVFPGELLSATHVDPRHPGEVVGRSEVKRREVYMKKLENLLLDSHPILVELVTNCLHNIPEMRPTAQQLLSRLQPVKMELETLYGGNLARAMNVANILQIKEIKMKDQRIKELEVSEVRVEVENAELTETITRLENEKSSLESANTQITREKNQVIANVSQLETDISRVQTEKNTAMAENNQLKTENNQLKTEKNTAIAANNQLKTENDELHSTKSQLECENLHLKSQESRHQQEKHSLQMEVERLTRQLQRTTEVTDKGTGRLKIPIFPLQLDWRCGSDMPVAMSGSIQSVEINGAVYVGGGHTDRDDDAYIVMAYNTQSCQWHTLPPYTTMWFAMTAINNKLVLVGGVDRDNSVSSELGEWQPDSNQWTRPFPPMPTSRWLSSATTYQHWLVVAGGYHGDRSQTVEVLDISNMQWSTGPSTPIPWSQMKSTTIANTWYLMGGDCGSSWLGSPDVYSVSLESLVSQSSSHSSTIWRKLPSFNSTYSCPLNIGGSLLAVGGSDMKSDKPVSTMQRYTPETNTWVQAGQLPHAVLACTCIMSSDKVHVMGGSDVRTRRKNIFTSTIL